MIAKRTYVANIILDWLINNETYSDILKEIAKGPIVLINEQSIDILSSPSYEHAFKSKEDLLEKLRIYCNGIAFLGVGEFHQFLADHAKVIDRYIGEISLDGRNLLIEAGSIDYSTIYEDQLIGRDEEVDRIATSMMRPDTKAMMVVGQPGIGLTSVLDGFGCKVSRGGFGFMEGYQAFSITGSKLLSTIIENKNLRTDVMLREMQNRRVVLVIDDFDKILALAMSGENPEVNSFANLLMDIIQEGNIRVVFGITTQYHNKLKSVSAPFLRKMGIIKLKELQESDLVKVIRKISIEFTEFNSVSIHESISNQIVMLCKRYPTSDCKLRSSIELLSMAVSSAIKRVDDSSNKDLIRDFLANRRYGRLIQYLESPQVLASIEPDDLVNAVVARTDIEKEMVFTSSTTLVDRVKAGLDSQVFGQTHVKESLVRMTKRFAGGANDPNKPLGCFMWLGPTGVGKTEMAKAITRYFYGSESALVRIDMSEFMESWRVSGLIGAAPGYIGFDKGGQLTNGVRDKNGYCVVLLDEFDKAHGDIQNILLQLMEDGRLTDGQGNLVRFNNTIVIMTSNLGSKTKTMGMADKDDARRTTYRRELERRYRPEFIGRLTQVDVFDPLDKKQIINIVEKHLKILSERITSNGKQFGRDLKLTWTDHAVEYIYSNGYDETYGGRTIAKYIDTVVSDVVTNTTSKRTGSFTLDILENQLVMTTN